MENTKKVFYIEIERTSFIEYMVQAQTQSEAQEIALNLAEKDHGEDANYLVNSVS